MILPYIHTSPDPVPDLPLTFWQLVEQRAATTPEARMLLDDRGAALSFGEYRDAAERVAAGLVAEGVGTGTVVSWQLPTSLEAFVLAAALTRIGAVANPIVPIMRQREVDFISHEVGTELFIVPGVFRGFDHAAMAHELAPGLGARVLVCGPTEDVLGSHGLALPDGDPAALPPFEPTTDAGERPPVRWLLHSSGTTADPKGIQHTDRSIMAGAHALIVGLDLGPDDLYPIGFPVTHIGGATMIVMSLWTGCRLGVISTFDFHRTPRDVAAMDPTVLGSAAPFLNAFIAAQREHGPQPLYPRLRTAVSGGAPTPPGLHEEIRRVLGGVGLMSSWGLTEFPNATHPRWHDLDADLATTEGRVGPGVEIRVVGADGKDQPPGLEGELRLRGPQLFSGYLNQALNADALDDQGFLHTGDLGIIDDGGHVRITGRLKDIIIRNAENISALEIENVLGGHPKIRDVAVIGLPDQRTGERCCAIVSLNNPDDTLTLAEVAEYCHSRGLAVQKFPEQLEIIDILPRNAMGKLQKGQLRDRFRIARDPAAVTG